MTTGAVWRLSDYFICRGAAVWPKKLPVQSVQAVFPQFLSWKEKNKGRDADEEKKMLEGLYLRKAVLQAGMEPEADVPEAFA